MILNQGPKFEEMSTFSEVQHEPDVLFMSIHLSSVNGNPSQYSWKNPIDRGAWPAIVHRIAESETTATAQTHTFTLRISLNLSIIFPHASSF